MSWVSRGEEKRRKEKEKRGEESQHTLTRVDVAEDILERSGVLLAQIDDGDDAVLLSLAFLCCPPLSPCLCGRLLHRLFLYRLLSFICCWCWCWCCCCRQRHKVGRRRRGQALQPVCEVVGLLLLSQSRPSAVAAALALIALCAVAADVELQKSSVK